MTKKHFEAIASVIKNVREGVAESTLSMTDITANDALNYVSIRLADVCESDNPNFDRDKFLRACGV